MTALTATQLVDILDDQTYPYPIRFFTTVPKFPLYPYIVVRKQPPVSTTKTVTDKTAIDGFEITLYIRYTKGQDLEEQDQTTIETTILTVLENTDFGTSALYFESKQWSRTPIPRLYGSQSKIQVSVTEKASTTGQGILGSEMTLTLPNAHKIKILALSSTEGNILEDHRDDVAIIRRDFSGIEQGDYTMEYESTPNNDTEIKGVTNGIDQNVTLAKKGVSRDLVVLFGQTSKRGQFDIIERATTRFTVQAVTSSVRVAQLAVDAILVKP